MTLRPAAAAIVVAGLVAWLGACLGGGLSDGGPDAFVDGDAAASGRDGPDDDAGPPAGAIQCGSVVCAAGVACCRVARSCAADCAGELPYTCDGAEDCGGNACCAIVGEIPLGSSCSLTPACDFGSALCHASGECAGGQTCCPGTWVAGYCADSC